MNRRRLFGLGAAAGIGALLDRREVWAAFPTQERAVVLRNAMIYDGLGGRPLEADVAIAGERIRAIGRALRVAGAEEVDLRGLALAPGFIDIHSHTDLVLFANPRAESKIRQGVTTEVVGQDGSSVGPMSPEQAASLAADYRRRYDVQLGFSELGGFFSTLERAGIGVNLASMIGTGSIREFVMGEENRPPTDAELQRMVALVSDALKAGACGVSSGLEYSPDGFSKRDELVAMARPLAGTGLPYTAHIRNEDDSLFAAIEEVITVGRFAGTAVQISHLKAQGQRNWWKAEPVFHLIEQARAAGTDVMFDRYPYIAYATGLSNLFPLTLMDGGTDAFLKRLDDPALEPRIEAAVRDKIAALGSWNAVQITSTGAESVAFARGRRLGDLARERSIEPYALLLEITRADRNRTGMVGFGMSEDNTADTLKHPLAMICSDAGARATYGPLAQGSPHPRAYGSFPRVLGYYCRDRKIMPLETAIRKMTSMPAKRLRLAGRGVIEPGAYADLVAFDPDKVADRATFEQPHQYPIGIPHVWVNGVATIRDGEHTEKLAGKALRPL